MLTGITWRQFFPSRRSANLTVGRAQLKAPTQRKFKFGHCATVRCGPNALARISHHEVVFPMRPQSNAVLLELSRAGRRQVVAPVERGMIDSNADALLSGKADTNIDPVER